MDTNKTDRPPPKARTVRPDCCAEDKCTSGSRNNYFPGKRLTPDTFRVEQKYLVERRHLINRAIHGWGVVYGYPVKMKAVDTGCPGSELGIIEVGEGLALDKMGRELFQTEPLSFTLDSVMLLNENGVLIRATGCDQKERISHLKQDVDACWLLSVHYAEQNTGPVMLKDPCSGERKGWDQVCETVRYSLRRVDCAKCCEGFDCDLKCSCATGTCCEEQLPTSNETREELKRIREESEAKPAEIKYSGTEQDRERLSQQDEKQRKLLKNKESSSSSEKRLPGRGGCSCLCDHLSGLQIGAECNSLCAVDDCARADLRNSVPLACVKLEQDDCKNWRFRSVYDACGPRRLVKRNDLLFDLIRGCDLTRITGISWGAWHRREVNFETFKNYFGGERGDGGNLTQFTVSFSGPVRAETVKADCFTMTAMFHEKEGGWREPLRVPIVDVYAVINNGLIDSATLVVRTKWVNDAIRGDETRFDTYGARIEIEIRGDYILDCNGQAIDANAVGLLDVPTGNGMPGGTYVSAFTVLKRETAPEKSAY